MFVQTIKKCQFIFQRTLIKRNPFNIRIYRALNFSTHSKVRVRFAPSPTGSLHLGGARTALYNYLLAKSTGGDFILRIEDTDASRTIPGSTEEIEKDLQWLSIIPDESPIQGGSAGPYIQSQRNHIYEKHVNSLIENGEAYKCYCSKERLAKFKKNISYDNHCRSLPSDELKRLKESETPFCIRLKQHIKTCQLNDLIYGDLELSLPEAPVDYIIVKSNGTPSYHFASVIDDHDMGITHVLRGGDWLTSFPKHLQLYKSLNWTPPQFAHLPQIVNADGTKLSKRQEAVQVRELRSQGFFPEAILNFLTLSGGGFEDIDHEALKTMPQLIQKFRLNLILTHPAALNLEKLDHYNRLDFQSQILDKEKLNVILGDLKKDVIEKFGKDLDVELSDQYLEKIVFWSQNRINTIKDLTSPAFRYLWTNPEEFSSHLKGLKLDTEPVLLELMESLMKIESSNFNSENISSASNSVQEKYKLKSRLLMQLIRLSTCGVKVGPPVNEVLTLLGKDRTLKRLAFARSVLK